MSTTGRPDAPRYVTLRDYVSVVRRHRLLILLMAVAFGAASYVLTSRQKANYVAQSSVYFQDTTQELNLLGTTVLPTLPDANRAVLNAQALTRPAVVEQVKAELHSRLSFSTLASSITTAVSTQTNAVVISASSSSPIYAEAVANAFATAVRTVDRRQTRAQFATMLASVRTAFQPLIARAPDPLTRAAYENRIAQIQLLARTADPVRILQGASRPEAPVARHTPRNATLGLLLGLTLGLLVAFLGDALDRRLRGSVEIAEQLGWPVIGHIRHSAFDSPAFVRRNGGSLDEESDRESFRMLRQGVRFLDIDNSPRKIVVTSALPEEGKSTVASSLACASAAAGTRTLLVECDLRRPSLGARFGVTTVPGLSDFLLGDATPADILQLIPLDVPPTGGSTNGTGDPSAMSDRLSPKSESRGLVCITAGRHVPEAAELLGAERFKTFLDEVAMTYELVVLDGGPLLSVADTALLVLEADATLVCVRAGQTTRDEAAALKLALDRLPHRLVGVVVTGVRPGGEHDLGYYSYAYTAEESAR